MPKFIVSRVSGKATKSGEMRSVITSVYADSYNIVSTNDLIPFHHITFNVSRERMFRAPVIARTHTLAVSGDISIEME